MTGYLIALYIYLVGAATVASIIKVNIEDADLDFVLTRALLYPVAFPFLILFAVFKKDAK